MTPIVIIGRFRYSNAKVMGVGHDWAEENADLTWVEGLTKVDTFHIAPDRGMAVYYFGTTDQAKTALPDLQKFFQGYAEMFDCQNYLGTGILQCHAQREADKPVQIAVPMLAEQASAVNASW